jgi:hypothetical protein
MAKRAKQTKRATRDYRRLVRDAAKASKVKELPAKMKKTDEELGQATW